MDTKLVTFTSMISSIPFGVVLYIVVDIDVVGMSGIDVDVVPFCALLIDINNNIENKLILHSVSMIFKRML